MQYTELGRSGMSVSKLCLGSMTWGTQNSYAEAAAQIFQALDAGVNFIDTAEMYPTTPLTAKTFGDTERIIGRWVKDSGRRADIVIASKILGNGRTDLDDGGNITSAKFAKALDASLARLGVDYLDLYQLHWPDRGSYHFRQHWNYDPSGQVTEDVDASMLDVLEAAAEAIKAGKIRALGLSNETAWGAQRFAHLAEINGLPRVASVQNEYSLLCRHFDLDLAEVSHHESIGLLAFSPLAAGILSGKYDEGDVPAASRRSINDTLGGRWDARSSAAAKRYNALARDHGLEPAGLAIAFCVQRPFMTSTIIGATTEAQLATSLSAADLVLSDELLDEIDGIRREHPMPM